MGRWGPTGLGPKEAALLGAAAVGDGGVVRLARVALRVAVRLGPRDALLLPAPRVVVRGVADVVVDERVGLLVVWVDLVLTVASLRVGDFGGLLRQAAALCWDEVVVLGDVLVGVVEAARARPRRRPGVQTVLSAKGVLDGEPPVVEFQGRKAAFIQAIISPWPRAPDLALLPGGD